MKILILFFVLFSGGAQAASQGEASLYYVPSEMSKGLLTFLVANDLKIPVTIRDVNQDKNSLKMAIDSGKKCGLKGIMLNSYPLFVYGKDCIVNDVNIMEYVEKHELLSLRK